MKPWHLILLVVMNCLWAGTYSSFKVLSPVLDAGGVVTLRFGLAAVVLLLCWPWLPGAAPRGRELVRAIVMGVMAFALAPRFQVAGVQMGRAADASMVVALEPLIVSVGAAIFLREPLGPRQWLGFVLGLVGVGLLSEIWRPDFHWPALAANALILLSLCCDSAYSIIGKPLMERAGLFKILAVAIVSGALVDVMVDGPSAVHAAARLTLFDWALVAYLSLICTLGGYALWFAVIRETQVNTVALTVFIQPVAGSILAMIWLGEGLHWGQTIGGLVILAGLLIGISRSEGSSQPQKLSEAILGKPPGE
jgi:drug/metabolite transporter (DMT)-like permease